MAKLISKLARIPGVRGAWQKFPVGPITVRAAYDIWRGRPQYGFGIWEAARLARWLGIPRISVVEFGVAQGEGLLAMERIAAEVEASLAIGIHVVGFDTGEGLPPPGDYRDLPHFWRGGFYRMNVDALRGKLRRAQLVLGRISETVPLFLEQSRAGPVGFAAFDVDYYSSTAAALRLFDGGPETHLPRVLCYFDNLIFPSEALPNEHVGEALAIREFNSRHPDAGGDFRQVTALKGLSYVNNYRAYWHEQFYCFHHFTHPLYTTSIHPRSVKRRLA